MTPEENRMLNETGRGTPMGELLRRYWVPALLSREVEKDSPAVRLRLFGEDLIAFRDTKGKVGLLSARCAHRGASLYFARNGDCGLRCVYHGWKYDVNGNCVDMPNEPKGDRIKHHVKQTAYPCIERNGIVMTYLGPADKQPPLPEFEWLNVPESHVHVSKRYQDCHWLQGMEGDIDSSHLGFLHGMQLLSQATEHDVSGQAHLVADNVDPRLEIVHKPNGFVQGACRNGDAENSYWRVGAWLMPCFTILPAFPKDSPLGGHAWVPADDTRVWAFGISWHPTRPLTEQERTWYREGTPTGIHSTLIPGTFIAERNRSNDYAAPDATEHQRWDRLKTFQDQDTAITESIGWDFDRSSEFLGSTDAAIVQARRRLLETARRLADGQDPPTDPAGYRYRGVSTLLPRGVASWSEAVAEQMDTRPETYRPSL